ncbi:hypothetical protein BJV77DRAFT_963907 [Russula vinacea]|nr:hypothetical protein BJV77DRAFT_963907 [Russula vinacea]
MSTATDSPRSDSNNVHKYKHAAPIPILTSPHRRRPSTSSDDSPTSPPTVQTPNPLYPTNLAPSSPTSPSFLSYLISTSPKTNASFPYKRPSSFGSSPPVFEDDDGQEIEVRNSLHQRRATTAWAGNGRAPQPGAPAPPVIEAQHARGAGVLRRLSLGGGLNSGASNRPVSPPRPATPPPSAVTPVVSSFAAHQNNREGRTRVRRSATVTSPSTNASARHRAPSPMGERILKGHFDSFN